ncbi:MAG TPA: GNAT family N-acetyltransferase, partial [Acidimicrobiales bacterium]|nr:GNAT family N-acetyltransferase [Acidimicrobiales bacterium]
DEGEWRERYARWTEAQIHGERPGNTTSVIEVGGERVGRLRVIRDDRRIELSGIQLRPFVQGRGIGTAIIDGLKWVWLDWSDRRLTPWSCSES